MTNFSDEDEQISRILLVIGIGILIGTVFFIDGLLKFSISVLALVFALPFIRILLEQGR